MKQRTILLWLLLVVLSRIPLIITGYGSDGDAWRVAESALRIWNEGIYEASRFPGFPVYEFLSVVFVGIGGSALSNVATLVVFLLSLVPLKKIVESWGVPMPGLFLVVFSFLPIVWKNSAATMDYLWGLAGIVMAIWLVIEQRFLLGGIMLGLAAGTRITHLAFLLPFLLIIPRGQKKHLIVFVLSSIGIAAACYIPVVLSPSWGELTENFFSQIWKESLWTTASVNVYRILYSVGLMGFLGVVAIAVLQRRRWKDLRHHAGFMFSFACIVMVLLLFVFLPGEREYLIPMMPFLLILIFLAGTKEHLVVVSILLLSFSFFSVDVIEHDTPTPRARFAFTQGIVLKELSERRQAMEWREQILSIDLPDSSIVMIGRGPIFGLENDSVKPARELGEQLNQSCYMAGNKREAYYVYSLNLEQLIGMRRRGFAVYYADDAKAYLESFVGYGLEDEKVLGLKVGGR
jgi:hypothetical protein